MKILISGGYGFFGYHLACELSKQDCEVTLLDIKPKNKFDSEFKDLVSKRNVNYLEFNLLDINSFDLLDADYTHIFHLAAILGVQNVLENPADVLSKNYKLLDNIINFAESLSTKPIFYFASTSEVYAGTLLKSQLEFPTPENSLLILPDLHLPRTSYMLSKIYGESICHASKIKAIVLRPHNLFGPRMGMKHVVPQLIRKIYSTPKGGSIGIYSPDHKRTFCFIKDAVLQVSKLVHELNFDEFVFNLGSQSPEITMRELASRLIEIMHREDIALEDLENTPGSPERRCPSTKKLDKLSNLTSRTSLKEGLEKTYSWYYKNKDIHLF